MADHSRMRLGRLPAKHDPRVPRMASYVTHYVDPSSVLWGAKVTDWRLMMNDVVGDCTAAAKGHLLMAASAETRTLWTPTDDEVLDFYSASTGYQRGRDKTDGGGVMTDVLRYLLNSGFCGRRIAAYGSVAPRNHELVRHTAASLCGLDVGLSLPVLAQSQDVWGEGGEGGSDEPNSWGGHCVYANGYDERYVYFVSWGEQMKMTWEFWDRYTDEAYGVLAGAFIREGHSPPGIDVDTLLRYTQHELRAT